MANNPEGTGESRTSVISAVRTPLGLCALIVLLIEGILAVMATKATGVDFTILVISMPTLLLVMIVLVLFLEPRSRQVAEAPLNVVPVAEPVVIKHEVFISSPMAGYSTNEAYEQNRAEVLKVAESFRIECKFKSIFFAGRDIDSIAHFEAQDISAKEDIEALRESKYFVLYYSEKIVSSVLFEAGVALELKKPSLFFVKNRKDLPFLMQEAEQAFPNMVKIYERPTVDDFIELIANHREELFPTP